MSPDYIHDIRSMMVLQKVEKISWKYSFNFMSGRYSETYNLLYGKLVAYSLKKKEIGKKKHEKKDTRQIKMNRKEMNGKE